MYKYKLQFVYDRKIYQFTARNVYKTIFNLKDLIDKKNTINLTSLTTRTAEGEDENNKHMMKHIIAQVRQMFTKTKWLYR